MSLNWHVWPMRNSQCWLNVRWSFPQEDCPKGVGLYPVLQFRVQLGGRIYLAFWRLFFILVNFLNFRPAEGPRQLLPPLPESRNLPSTDGIQTKLEINLVCKLTKLIWISEYLDGNWVSDKWRRALHPIQGCAFHTLEGLKPRSSSGSGIYHPFKTRMRGNINNFF